MPDLSGSSDAALGHAWWQNAPTYGSFLVSLYVIATYWQRHRRLMRHVTAVHPRLIFDPLCLLLLVAGMPFFASLLCIPAGYALHSDGPFVLVVLAVPVQVSELRQLDIRHIRRPVRR